MSSPLRIVNDAASRLMAEPPAELQQACERVLATGKPLSLELHVEKSDRWYETSIHPLDAGIAVYTHDVTMRKRALELTTRLARVTALRTDINSCLAGERDIPTMLRRVCEALVEHLELGFARISTVNDTGNTLLLQGSAGMDANMDGEQASIPLLVDGKPVGVLSMLSQHAIPEDTFAVLETIADLVAQGLVRQRTELELEQRIEELARSNAELEQFAYVASHDLQEPLRMIASYNHQLARRYKGKLGEDADEFIDFSVEGVTRMQRLINDLLAYSRIGTRAEDKTEVDLDAVLKVALLGLESAIRDSKAHVTHDELPHVHADESQMVLVLQNLIGNALKFHRADVAPRIHIGVITNGFGHTISVRDNGIGIEPQSFDRIFMIFQRLNTREKYPGTGIGLAVCKKIVERHGGRIWVESAPDRGSTIHFTLPSMQRRHSPRASE